ncbi:MAG: pentapeptide repeat-containing protein [Planctomycetota bacterium]|nr:MAG: pentapeptide repeat-containing protein [Planctomycetota bacterium]
MKSFDSAIDLIKECGTNLSNKDLTGMNFSGLCLVGVDFSGSDCSFCCFDHSDLSLAKFVGSNLYQSSFKEAVLYVTCFEGSNLTRASFRQSFLYGVIFHGANPTYADFSSYRLEMKRRMSVKDVASLRQIAIGTSVDIYKLEAFAVGNKGFRFREYRLREARKVRSQIHNRLKRLYRDFSLPDQAATHYYQEKYWNTRSLSLNSPMQHGLLKTSFSLVLGFLNELLCGYGEKPHRALLSLVVWMCCFASIYWCFHLFLFPNTEDGIGHALYLSATCCVTGVHSDKFSLAGKVLVSVQAWGSICLIALFAAALIRRVIRD